MIAATHRDKIIVTKSYLLLALSYVAALIAAAVTIYMLGLDRVGIDLLIALLIADVVATIVIFIFSLASGNSSYYDPYWSVIPVFIAGYLIWHATGTTGDNVSLREWLLLFVISAWAVRLTVNFLYGWQGLGHIDWRYTKLKDDAGIAWQVVNFFGIHLIPTLIVFLACVPVYYVTHVPHDVGVIRPLNIIDALALAVGVISVWLEYQSDVELHRFRAVRASRQEVLDTGLWSLCRHPNYLGEMGLWLSVFLFGYAAMGAAPLMMSAGVVVMLLLFVAISIPMIENKLAGDKPGYAAYKARTFAILPLSFLKS